MKVDKLKKDLKKLINKGDWLHRAIRFECLPEKFEQKIDSLNIDKKDQFLEKIPNFNEEYQSWYSEALVLIKQLLPDRLEDFTSLYKSSKNNDDITRQNYSIEHNLQGIVVREPGSVIGGVIVGKDAAIPNYRQQLSIVKAVKKRFESTLFDIETLLQRDLFDSELEAAKELMEKGFLRGAGAIAGVVLEEHFQHVCKSHNIKESTKDYTIGKYNSLLKKEGIIEKNIFRFIQRLGDLRNKCDHKEQEEPSIQDIEDLIDGTDRIIKTVC